MAFGDQYARELVRLGDAHGVTRGTGVVVAVLDTGIDGDHSLLRDRIVPGGYNFVDDNEDLRDIGDGIDNDRDDPPCDPPSRRLLRSYPGSRASRCRP